MRHHGQRVHGTLITHRRMRLPGRVRHTTFKETRRSVDRRAERRNKHQQRNGDDGQEDRLQSI